MAIRHLLKTYTDSRLPTWHNLFDTVGAIDCLAKNSTLTTHLHNNPYLEWIITDVKTTLLLLVIRIEHSPGLIGQGARNAGIALDGSHLVLETLSLYRTHQSHQKSEENRKSQHVQQRMNQLKRWVNSGRPNGLLIVLAERLLSARTNSPVIRQAEPP